MNLARWIWYWLLLREPRFRRWTLTFPATHQVSRETLEAILDSAVIDEGAAGKLTGVCQSIRFYTRIE